MTLNWDTEAECQCHVYFKVLNELASTEEFNKELYGVEDLGVTNYRNCSFIQEKLNLIMAGEESTVGVTVQQYLAEVERTITDPTLTSTYDLRLLNTVKQDLLYHSFFGRGCYDCY
jgi:hypothetical protein